MFLLVTRLRQVFYTATPNRKIWDAKKASQWQKMKKKKKKKELLIACATVTPCVSMYLMKYDKWCKVAIKIENSAFETTKPKMSGSLFVLWPLPANQHILRNIQSMAHCMCRNVYGNRFCLMYSLAWWTLQYTLLFRFLCQLRWSTVSIEINDMHIVHRSHAFIPTRNPNANFTATHKRKIRVFLSAITSTTTCTSYKQVQNGAHYFQSREISISC